MPWNILSHYVAWLAQRGWTRKRWGFRADLASGPIPGLGGRETADSWKLVLRKDAGKMLGC